MRWYVQSDEQHGEETVAQPARTVIKRAIRKITVRPALRRSIPLPNLKLRSNVSLCRMRALQL